jgi:GNAT superfamily N-acetyltransferase
MGERSSPYYKTSRHATSEARGLTHNSQSQRIAMIINMMVDLSDSFDTDGEAALLAAAGVTLEHRHGAAERDIAWIRATFGGTWQLESAAGWNWFARKADGALGGFCTYEQHSHRFWWILHWLDQADVGIFGPMGVDRALRGRQIGKILARRALGSMKSMGLARAIIAAVGPVAFYEHCCGAAVVERLERPV